MSVITNGSIRVLLVEDDKDDYILTRQLLEDVGRTSFELDWVSDYQEALSRACANTYDVALVDYRLGQHDGVALVRETAGRGCRTPIIVLTGQGDHTVDMAAMRAGAVDFLNKAQLTPDLLERSIRYAIQQKEAEEQRYRSFGELIPYGIWNADREGRMLYFSKSFLDVVGKTLEQCRGDAWIELLHPEDRDAIRTAWQQTLESGSNCDSEFRILGQDGRYRSVLCRGIALRDEQGRPTGWVGINLDITDRKRAERELLHKTEELQRSNAEWETFASVISHDLRSPLLSMTGCLELLLEQFQGKLTPETKELADLIRGSVRHMGELIKSLLDYSRAGSSGLRLAAANCETVLASVLQNLRGVIADSGATVTHDPLPTVTADERHLTQLLQNLIENAIKYHGKEPPQVHVSAKEQDNEWVFSVRDNGIGIDRQYFGKVFKVFQRLHGESSQYTGTGIGLAICKKIVERHGGRIWLESAPGKGSTFYFTIPARPAQ